MATSIKIYIQKKPKRDGLYSIYFRLLHNRMARYIPTNISVRKSDIGKNGELKNSFILKYVDNAISSYRERIAQIGHFELEMMSVDEIYDAITKQPQKKVLDFFEFGEQYIQRLITTGHESNAKTYRIALNSFAKFLGKQKVNINEITAHDARQWITWLTISPNRLSPTRQRGQRAQSQYPATLRALFNRAIEELTDDSSVVPANPFSRAGIPAIPPSRKRALSSDQIRCIAFLPDSEREAVNYARDMFILSFLMIGMNAADMYECLPSENGIIKYNRKKTRNRRSDQAYMQIRVEPELQKYLDKYCGSDTLLNCCKRYSNVATFTARVNHALKVVGEAIGVPGLQFYSARHSWATIAVNEIGIDKYVVHEALNHVDDSMKVTDIYIKKDYTAVEVANRKVIDLIFHN